MTEHPRDLYADYEDGSLGPEERSRVESHLASCRVCRGEVEETRKARAALAALPEVEEPAGLASWVVRRAGRRPILSPRLAWAASAAAVAAAVILVSVTFLGDGGGEQSGAPIRITELQRERTATGGADDAAEPTAESGKRKGKFTSASGLSSETVPVRLYPLFRTSQANYDPANLAGLLRDLRQDVSGARKAGFPPTASEFYARFEPLETPEPAAAALNCVNRAAQPDQTLVPFLIEAAAFEGAPAYLAAFLQGPAETEPYDRILLFVVERKGCVFRHFGRQLL